MQANPRARDKRAPAKSPRDRPLPRARPTAAPAIGGQATGAGSSYSRRPAQPKTAAAPRPLAMRPWLFFVLCGTCAGALGAQGTAQKGLPTKERAPERAVRGTVTPGASHDLFQACDADGNDRLDLLEVADALEGMRDDKDLEGFATLDRDRNGFVSWPEFDAQLRSTLERGGTFRVRPLRPFALPTPEARTATPVQRFIQAFDQNQNGALDRPEVDDFLRKTKLGRDVGVSLWALDDDRSGRLEEAELAPWLEKIPTLAPKVPLPIGGTALPEAWQSADANHNGVLALDEFEAVLRRLDPALTVWAAELFAALDKNRDGALQPGELPGAPDAKPLPGKTAALVAPAAHDLLSQLPPQAAVR